MPGASSLSLTAHSLARASSSVVASVVVSPRSAGCITAETTAPDSRSTTCSGLYAMWVRPSLSLPMRASSSVLDCQSLLEVFLSWRLRSKAINSALVGVLMPLALAKRKSIF